MAIIIAIVAMSIAIIIAISIASLWALALPCMAMIIAMYGPLVFAIYYLPWWQSLFAMYGH